MCSLKNTIFLNVAALSSCESSLLPETRSGDTTMSFNSAKLQLYRLPFSQVISHQLGLSPLHFFYCIAAHSDVSKYCQLFCMWKGELHHHSKKKIVLLDVQISKKPKKLETCALSLVRQCLFFSHAWLPMIIIILSN